SACCTIVLGGPICSARTARRRHASRASARRKIRRDLGSAALWRGARGEAPARSDLLQMKIAYLVSDYSAPSHTFVRREVAALRLRGIEIAAFSVQPVAREGEAESLLGRPLLAYFAAIAVILATRPGRFVSTWWLALRHRVGGLRAL